MRRLMVLAASLLALAMNLAAAAPALAAFCVPPDVAAAMREGRPVFTGTVVAVANRDRWASVAIDEIWSGPSLPRLIEVRGSEIVDQNVWFDADRTYLLGRRYLFAPEVVGGRLRDHACTPTNLWVEGLERFRPNAVREPEELSSAGSGPDVGVLAVPLGVGGIGAAAVLWRSWRDRRRPAPR
jgi:hypothetical protein